MSTHCEYFLLETTAGEQYRVVVTVDMATIAGRLASRAHRSKAGRATAMYGAVVVEELLDTPPKRDAGSQP